MATTAWASFLAEHRGQGLSMTQLSTQYRAGKGKKPARRRRAKRDDSSSTAVVRGSDTPFVQGGDSDSEFYVRLERNHVHFTGDLSEKSCSSFRHALESAAVYCLNNIKSAPTIQLHLQSTGGNVLPAMSVIDWIRGQPLPVHCHVEGYAMSCGAALVTACHHRTISPNGVMLLHQYKVHASNSYFRSGDLARETYNLEVLTKLGHAMFSKYSKLKPKQLKELELQDRLLTAAECLQYGLVDKIR